MPKSNLCTYNFYCWLEIVNTYNTTVFKLRRSVFIWWHVPPFCSLNSSLNTKPPCSDPLFRIRRIDRRPRVFLFLSLSVHLQKKLVFGTLELLKFILVNKNNMALRAEENLVGKTTPARAWYSAWILDIGNQSFNSTKKGNYYARKLIKLLNIIKRGKNQSAQLQMKWINRTTNKTNVPSTQ